MRKRSKDGSTKEDEFPMRPMRFAVMATALVFAASGVASATQDKVTICHAAGLEGTTKYVTLTISPNAVYGANGNAGHFEENGTPRAGHEQDYFGACQEPEPTPKPTPPPTPEPTPKPTPAPTPPPTVVPPISHIPLRVTGYLCGDPRVHLTIANLNSTKEAVVVRYVSGKDGTVRKVTRRVKGQGLKTPKAFWIKGRTMFKVWDAKTGLLAYRLWTGRKSNTGPC